MTCYFPIKAYRGKIRNKNGKSPIVFNAKHGFADRPLQLPCGQCTGCRLERSRQWAIRCMHEKQMHSDNAYITLTYNNAHLPEGGSVVKRDFQLFMKRLRKSVEPKKIRYFHCGEYGDENNRPHYHAIIFGHDFGDRKRWKQNQNGDWLYTSKSLSEQWHSEEQSMGFCTTGDVTFQSAAYVARYIMKKVTGDLALNHYTSIDETTGEIHSRIPEYVTMSRRPGIGSDWLKKYSPDVYPSDQVIMNSVAMKPPKFYDNQMEKHHPKQYQKIRAIRLRKAKLQAANNTPARLKVRHSVLKARMKQLKRSLSNGEENT